MKFFARTDGPGKMLCAPSERIYANRPSRKWEGLLKVVGVAGFEPAASWTRTKRDTKLRHTPIAYVLYRKFRILSRGRFLCFGQAKSNNTAHSRFRLAVRCYSVLDQLSLRNFPAVLFYLPSFSAFLAALALALAS